MTTSHAPDPAPGVPRFTEILSRMIELLNDRLAAVQRGQLAAAMPSIRWEFPDVGSLLHLVAEPDALRLGDAEAGPALFVRMSRETLEDAAFGRRSLGAAFLSGRIHVRGLSPARLREFILLVDPLLQSYREAHGDLTLESAAPAPLVP